jgi:hypothetical protein
MNLETLPQQPDKPVHRKRLAEKVGLHLVTSVGVAE